MSSGFKSRMLVGGMRGRRPSGARGQLKVRLMVDEEDSSEGMVRKSLSSEGSSRVRLRQRKMEPERSIASSVDDDGGNVSDEDSSICSSMSSVAASDAASVMGKKAARSVYSQSAAGQTLTELAAADEPMHIEPWCCKCPNLPPTGMLPLNPDDVSAERRMNRNMMEANMELGIGNDFGGPGGLAKFTIREDDEFDEDDPSAYNPDDGEMSRMEIFKNKMSMTRRSPGFCVGHLAPSLDAIWFPSFMKFSRFSVGPCRTEKVVLKALTEEQVGTLELFCVNHVKRQYIEAAVACHLLAPRQANNHRNAMKYAAVCQLLLRTMTETLSEPEYEFLLEKLKTVPFLSDMPDEKLPAVAKDLQVLSYLPGDSVFKESEEVTGVYILVMGRAILRSDQPGSLVGTSVKEAPCALLVRDVLRSDKQKRHPFLPRAEKDRFWSRTASTALGRDDSTSLIRCIFVPFASISMISDHYRQLESGERRDLILRFFAPAMKISVELCAKHIDVFSVETFYRNNTFVTEGAKPTLSHAYLRMVVDGEVQIVHPKQKRSANQAKEMFRRGDLIGEAALYGEEYPHSAIVSTETCKVLSVRVVDYLHKLLDQRRLLERPRPESSASSSVYSEQHLHSGEKDEHKERGTTSKTLLSTHLKQLRIKRDVHELKKDEWQSVRPRGELPKPKPPTDGPAKKSLLQGASSGSSAPATPTRSPLLHRRSIHKQIMDFDTPLPSANLQAPIGPSVDLVGVLDDRIAKSANATGQLLLEHRAHAAFGVHVEDIGGRSKGRYLPPAPRPGSVVLLACGSVSSRAGF